MIIACERVFHYRPSEMLSLKLETLNLKMNTFHFGKIYLAGSSVGLCIIDTYLEGNLCRGVFVAFFFRYRTRDRAARRSKVQICMSAVCRKIWRSRIWRISSVLMAELSRRGYCAITLPVGLCKKKFCRHLASYLPWIFATIEQIFLVNIFVARRKYKLRVKVFDITVFKYRVKLTFLRYFTHIAFFIKKKVNLTVFWYVWIFAEKFSIQFV